MSIPTLIRTFAFSLLVASSLLLAACSAPGDKPASTAVEEAPTSVGAAPMPTAVATTPAKLAPTPAAPASAAPEPPAIAVPEGKPSMPPPSLGQDSGRACKTSADCAVKDAGSCCGYRPVCVNKDTPTFPEKVKAACANEGRVGICGFQAIDGCECVSGKCEGLLMMENSAPVQ